MSGVGLGEGPSRKQGFITNGGPVLLQWSPGHQGVLKVYLGPEDTGPQAADLSYPEGLRSAGHLSDLSKVTQGSNTCTGCPAVSFPPYLKDTGRMAW